MKVLEVLELHVDGGLSSEDFTGDCGTRDFGYANVGDKNSLCGVRGFRGGHKSNGGTFTR